MKTPGCKKRTRNEIRKSYARYIENHGVDLNLFLEPTYEEGFLAGIVYYKDLIAIERDFIIKNCIPGITPEELKKHNESLTDFINHFFNSLEHLERLERLEMEGEN